MVLMLWGALAMSCWVAGMFFFKFWKAAQDRLFLFFALGFWSFTAHWVGLVVAAPSVETRHWFYLVRLAAFIFILVGIVDKNRRAR